VSSAPSRFLCSDDLDIAIRKPKDKSVKVDARVISVDIVHSSQHSSGNDAVLSFEGRWGPIDIVVLFEYSSPSIEAAVIVTYQKNFGMLVGSG
jgi:hypothetical protein